MRHASLLFLFLAGCGSQDGDILAKVFRRAGEKLEAAAGGSANQFASRLRSNAAYISARASVQAQRRAQGYGA